jgi:hypothetical protein
MNPFSARIPDSTLAKATMELLVEVAPPFLVNHCLRTYIFGDILGKKTHIHYDRELFYLAALLHDLGLTDRFDGDGPFEVEGANAAYAFLTKQGLPIEKATVVREAIALHLSVLADLKAAEISLLHVGTDVDVAGLGLDEIPPHMLSQVLAVYPRLGFKQALLAVCRSQAERKPTSTIATLFRQGFTEMITLTPFSE